MAESLGGFLILSWDFYKHNRAIFQYSPSTVFNGSEFGTPFGPTPDSAADGAVLLDDAEISQYLKIQSKSDKSGKIFVVIPEDVSSEDVVVGVKRD